MKKLMLVLALVSLFTLTGCRQDIKDGPHVGGGSISSVDHKVSAESQNAIQQNVQSALGVAVGKLTDTIKGVEANVQASVKGIEANIGKIDTTIKGIEGNFDTKIGKLESHISTAVKVNTELTAHLENQIKVNAELNNHINIQAKLVDNLQNTLTSTMKVNGELSAQLTFDAKAQVGLSNKIDENKNTAGRDIRQIQFNKEMLEALQSANYTIVGVVIVFALILIVITGIVLKTVITILSGSRERSDARANNLFKIVMYCIGKISPNEAKEISETLKNRNLSEPQ